jgi:hypothetical protein
VTVTWKVDHRRTTGLAAVAAIAALAAAGVEIAASGPADA